MFKAKRIRAREGGEKALPTTILEPLLGGSNREIPDLIMGFSPTRRRAPARGCQNRTQSVAVRGAAGDASVANDRHGKVRSKNRDGEAVHME